ncbi:MAG TPA: hypothetical protein VIM12_02680 [Noviherbaspirillum sp.]|uniref:hypothetical protein n=1 Tax=Noviherbaspirillum sp. TaxID=1926288 RepID=UPI002F926F87
MFAAVSASANADDLGLQGDIGTTGVGFHATIPLRENLNARLGLGYLGYSYDGNTRNMDYRLHLKANTYDALLDWYPSKESAFRVTAGLAYNGNKIEAHGAQGAGGSYRLGGGTYDAAAVGEVRGRVSFNKIAPYLGIGWGRGSRDEKGWSFSTDIGVLFQGNAKTSLSSSGCSASTAVCGQLAADLARENRELRKEADRFKVYPVLRVGIGYTF